VSEHKKKLIEVALPLEAINRASAREKSIRHGHPSTLHLWWARRPLAACRAILFAQLVDDPSSRPDLYPTEEMQVAARARLFSLIEELVLWENIGNERVLRAAKAEIAQSTSGSFLAVADPFAGGGSIPLEAKRLGLEVFANDLNPLPVLINTVMLNVAGRFAFNDPISGGMAQNPQQALATDVTHWAQKLQDEVQRRVGTNYVATPEGGSSLVYFWARTIQCPNPPCSVLVPLVGSWVANGRKGKEQSFFPLLAADGKNYDVDVRKGAPTTAGTMERQGGICLRCGGTFPLDYVKSEGNAGRLGARLLAVQYEQSGIKILRPATDEDRLSADVDAPQAEWLDQLLSTHPQYMAPPRYGLTTFRDLFLPRQLATMIAFVDALPEIRDAILSQAEQVLSSGDQRSFMEGGTGAHAYADSLTMLLALSIGRLANRASTLCIWDAPGQTVQQVFARQAYSMTWLFAEANPFSGATGSYMSQVGYLARVIERLPAGQGYVTQGPAQDVSLPHGVVVSTDPPYYDSVPYAELSDYFLVWLRPMLQKVMPGVFDTVLSPKSDELVADHVRHGGKENASAFFDAGLARVFSRVREVHSDEIPMTVYYAFKADDTGWETFLSSLLKSGWLVSGTWPVRTEQASGLRQVGRNALASSVVVVCRKRSYEAEAVTRRAFVNALKVELPNALREMQQGSVAPVDMAQAAIGPGMGVFSRYSRVLEADGSDMTVRTALALINQALDEVLVEQEGDFDPETRFALKWFSQFGWSEAASGEADVLARAVNTTVGLLERGGIFRAAAGKARLLEPSEMSAHWNPADDRAISVWEVAVRLGHALLFEGTDQASAWMRESASRVNLDSVKELTYLMYSVCEHKGWAESALLFNVLGTSWSEVAGAARSDNSSAQHQGSLDFGEDDE